MKMEPQAANSTESGCIFIIVIFVDKETKREYDKYVD